MINLLALPLLAGLNLQSGDTSDPVAVTGGFEAGVCAWPSVVSLLTESGVRCSAVLVHPRVVLTAAHCLSIDPVARFGFGESDVAGSPPVRTAVPSECVAHPDFDLGSLEADVAFCVLPEPVDDVPIIPILEEERQDLVVPGRPVTMIGFGSTFALGRGESTGSGFKKFVGGTIDLVEPYPFVLIGSETGSDGPCFGDSGGPTMMQLDDGTWRVIGVASTLYDPGDLPPPVLEGNFCGTGGAYTGVAGFVPWLEAASGFDLAPCADSGLDGECLCGAADPARADGDWEQGCAQQRRSSCEPGAEGTSTGTDGDTTAATDTSASSSGRDGATGGEGTAGGARPGSSSGGASASAGASSADASGKADDASDEGGCAVRGSPRTTGGDAAAIAALFGLLIARRKKRPRPNALARRQESVR